jgi:hypothetical protein
LINPIKIYFRNFKYLDSVEILFSSDSLLLLGCLEGDPLSPPEGEAAQGEHPLDPPLFQRVSIEPIFVKTFKDV